MNSQAGKRIDRYQLLYPYNLRGDTTLAYVAIDTRLHNRQVIIELLSGSEYAERQIKELATQSNIHELTSRINSLVQLDHPDILPITDFGRNKGVFYIVYGYVPEETLRKRHPRGTKIPLATVVSYTKQIASALQDAHDNHIIHQDVKPENIFVLSDNTIMLGNFGLKIISSRMSISTEKTIDLIGTPEYMAPEVFDGRTQFASDQYALGIVVYEWVSGQLPFNGTTPIELAIQHKMQPPESLHSIIPEIPLEVEEVLAKALDKNPHLRFPNVQAFAKALENASKLNPTYPPPLSGLRPGDNAYYSPYSPGQITGSPAYNYDTSEENLSTTSNLYLDLPLTQPEQIDSSTKHSADTPQTEALSRRRVRHRLPFLGGRGKQKPQKTDLSLFAIAHAALEQDDRAIVGQTYTLQAGISQQRLEDFYSLPLKISVKDPLQPVPFHILLHPGENVELLGQAYQNLMYNPGKAEPQFIFCPFRVKSPGQSYLLVNFYRERQWLKTIRIPFDGIEQALSSSAIEER